MNNEEYQEILEFYRKNNLKFLIQTHTHYKYGAYYER